jgi:hypothetical protein
MIILVSYTAATYKAQIRSDVSRGFKTIYTATCTGGEIQAARAVLRKYYGEEAAASVRQITDRHEVSKATGDFQRDPKRKQVFTYWGFTHKGTQHPHRSA